MQNSNVTQLLQRWCSGDEDALQQLTPLVYDDLRRIAARQLRNERSDHTLQATALVHEAYGKLVDSKATVENRAHFLAVAARAMRQILVDYGRARRSQKRGGGEKPAALVDDRYPAPETADIVDLHEALDALAKVDLRKSDVLVLHYFGGLTYPETATALGISEATVERDLRLGKAWLAVELGTVAGNV